MATLGHAVRIAATTWAPIVGGGDPNTIDVYQHARTVEELMKLDVPATLPPKQRGVAVVELVERLFVSGSLIRNHLPDVLVQRAGALADEIGRAVLLEHSSPHNFICALYAWHGCINMAKLVRRTFVIPGGEAEYTIAERLRGYALLEQCWSAEDSRANPWVRYGVSLARSLEEGRQQDEFPARVVENWVPAGSPYWAP